MGNTPWTPAPWRAQDAIIVSKNGGDIGDFRTNMSFCDEIPSDIEERDRANAQLAALAPEMAEAILAFDAKWWGEVMQPAMDYLHEIAEKLREIGAVE